MRDSDATIPARMRAIADTLATGSQELHDLASDVERLLGSLAEVKTLANDLCECDDGACAESVYRAAILDAIGSGWLRGSREAVRAEVWARAAQFLAPRVIESWLDGSNGYLEGARPRDLLQLGRVREVMEALAAEEQKVWGG